MLTILANSFLTATRQERPAPRPVREPRNPLSRVRIGGLILTPRKTGR